MSSLVSSSSSSNPNPSSSKDEWLYDVFLTFQTKSRTVRCLQIFLKNAAMKTFIDNDEKISPTLLEAIERSRIVIFVFSKDFGSSRDCLDKLDKIMKSHNQTGKKVLPVLCGVSLIDVRQQMGSIAELTSRGDLEKQNFFRWRSAFTEATSLSRWIWSTECSRYDAKINNVRETTLFSDKPKPKYKHEVLLSFCGDDTRRSFTTHLYIALKRAGIAVFMDNNIRKGEEIASSLMQAIESAKISIIIFSIRYAGSKWCLQEIEKIMECHRTIGQKVFPIFYGVPPSDVRNQRDHFGDEMEKLRSRITPSENQISNWKIALSEAANFNGWDWSKYRNDAEIIVDVVETLKMELYGNKRLCYICMWLGRCSATCIHQ